MPEMEFTGDNAAMIALAAYFRALKIPHTAGRAKKIGDGSKIAADSNLKLK
jgi:tRNA A37 threonylcarbamoyltransferase TsaD